MMKMNWVFLMLMISVATLTRCKKLEELDGPGVASKDSTITGSIDSTKAVIIDTTKITGIDTSKITGIDTTLTVVRIDTTSVSNPDNTSNGGVVDTTKNYIVDTTSNPGTVDLPVVVPPVAPPVAPQAVLTPQVFIPSLNIIFDGDSQTKRGYYPSKTIELLKSKGYTKINITNTAVAGQNTSNMISDVSTQIVPKYNSSYTKNIVIYWIGANDAIRDAATDTAKLYQYLLKYYTTLKSKGFKVVMVNLPDANRHIGTNIINAMLAKRHSKISDLYVNCRTIGGAFEKNKNLTYYTADGVHLNTNGYNHLAQTYVFPKLYAYLKQ